MNVDKEAVCMYICVCVLAFRIKMACESKYLHPQEQTTLLRFYISNRVDLAKCAAVSKSTSLKLCISNQTSVININSQTDIKYRNTIL